MVLDKILESPWDCKEVKPVNSKGNQSWIFTGRTDAEAEAPILRPPNEKNWLTGKDPNAGKEWRQEEKGMTEDEMVEWHHRLNGHEFEQAPGVGDGQGGLVCCSPWGRKDLDTTEWLNWLTELMDVENFKKQHDWYLQHWGVFFFSPLYNLNFLSVCHNNFCISLNLKNTEL